MYSLQSREAILCKYVSLFVFAMRNLDLSHLPSERTPSNQHKIRRHLHKQLITEFIHVSSVDLNFLLCSNLRVMWDTRIARDPHGRAAGGCF